MRFSSPAERGLAEVGLVIAAMGCRPEVRVRGIVFADQQRLLAPASIIWVWTSMRRSGAEWKVPRFRERNSGVTSSGRLVVD